MILKYPQGWIVGKICGEIHICSGNLKTTVGSKNRLLRFVHVIRSKNFTRRLLMSKNFAGIWTNLGCSFFDQIIVFKFSIHMWFALHIFPG